MKIILTGATGMVGSEVLKQALADTEITAVAAIVRKPVPVQHPKLTTIIRENFLDYSNLTEVFKNYDACIWCLGISQLLVTKEEYIVITYDYALAAANAMLKANPSIGFLFLSGAGADSKEKSRTIFARIKGKTENALLKLPFKKFYIARPAGIKPMQLKRDAKWYEKLLYYTYPFFKLITPAYVITSEELAKAMLNVVKNGYGNTVIENGELKELVI